MDEELRDREVKKILFYVRGTPLVENLMTICLFLNKDGLILSRGISICSLLDSFKWKEGKNKSYGRAKKALFSEVSSERISINRFNNKKVPRFFKIKNDTQYNYFYEEIVPHLDELGEPFKISEFKNKSGKIIKRCYYKIPRIYPLEVARSIYKYKSDFRPGIMGDEIEFIKEVINS